MNKSRRLSYVVEMVGEEPDFDAVADGIQEAIDTLSDIRGGKSEGDDAAGTNDPVEGSDQ